MTNILITGSNGFVGKNLLEGLGKLDSANVFLFNRSSSAEELDTYLANADVIYHLAGINRPVRPEDFQGNVELTEQIIKGLKQNNKKPKIIFASTIHALSDNDYGRSKKAAEEALIQFGSETAADVYIFRLPNLFGKWCKPHYNSVVATFCHNISRDLEITISDPDQQLELAYIDDVVKRLLAVLAQSEHSDGHYYSIEPTYSVTLGGLANQLMEFKKIRSTSILPTLSDPFTKYLYSTYLSHLDRQDFAYPIQTFNDHRGSLFEAIKSEHAGQLFVSTTVKGVERGNHYHNTKVEKFCVIKGKALVKFRHIFEDESFTYTLSDEKITILDIPPGYTHAIENISEDDLIVLFWANEIFDASHPDTYPSQV
jgi:UDP-2-acetamido-2,6-beta-L-arabino-hexul-4-ose reductase